jgi:hypothetical protein
MTSSFLLRINCANIFSAEFVHINSAFSGANAVRARFSEMPRPQKQTQAASIARRGRTVEFAAA